MIYSRRDLANAALGALTLANVTAKPSSKRVDSSIDGVQIGLILSPYNYPEIPVDAGLLLPKLVQLGISAVELQDVRG